MNSPKDIIARFDGIAKKILITIQTRPYSVDELVTTTNHTIADVLQSLTQLEIQGVVSKTPQGLFFML